MARTSVRGTYGLKSVPQHSPNPSKLRAKTLPGTGREEQGANAYSWQTLLPRDRLWAVRSTATVVTQQVRRAEADMGNCGLRIADRGKNRIRIAYQILSSLHFGPRQPEIRNPLGATGKRSNRFVRLPYTKFFRTAQTAACVRSVTPIFRRMCCTWSFTVS